MQDKIAVIYGINGPVVTVKNAPWLMMKEMTFVGSERLIGEVIAIHGEDTVGSSCVWCKVTANRI